MMPDREKVIKELMELHGSKETMNIISDAIALLKEQEAKEQCLKTKCIICPHCDNCDVDENELLKAQETVVRCKDCTYLNADTGICIVGIPHGNKETFYCAYGKKAVK